MIRLILFALLFQSNPVTPDSIPWQRLYADAVNAMKNEAWTEATTALEAVLASNPSHIPSRFNLAVSLGEAGDTARALETYRELLVQDATIFEARMNLAIMLSENGNAEQAAAEFAAAGLLRPEDPLPALYRAQMLDEMGQTDAAIGAYAAVIGIDFDLVEPHERLGLLYRRMDRLDEAHQELTHAVNLGSTAPAVFVALGDIENRRGNLDRARDRYQRAALLAPGDDNIRLRLALALRDQGLSSEALAILEELPGTESVLADGYMANHDYARAAAVYEDLTREYPENTDYWETLGRAYYELGRPGDSEAALQKALNLEPERVSSWGTLALIYFEREDWTNAGIILTQYIGLQPNHATSHFLLAVCFDNLGEYEKALVHYNKFIELDAGDDDVRSLKVRQRANSIDRYLQEYR